MGKKYAVQNEQRFLAERSSIFLILSTARFKKYRMQANFLSVVLMPIALAIIMTGLGLSLTIADFKRVYEYPKAVIIGLGTQMILLPIICFFIVKALDLPAELAVGLMLLAAAPGGPSANLYSHIAKGDVALNVTLTALNSILSVISIAFIVNLSMKLLMQQDAYIPLQFSKVLEVCMIVILPVSIGMIIRKKAPAFSARLESPVKILSAIFLALIIFLAGWKERDHLMYDIQTVGLACLLFNVACLSIGYYLPRLLNLDKKQAIAIGMEIGIHNGTLAIFIALNVIGNGTMTIPAVIYSIIMFITAAIFGWLVNLRN
jgi:BASS family bile acid:Na+ symporter